MPLSNFDSLYPFLPELFLTGMILLLIVLDLFPKLRPLNTALTLFTLMSTGLILLLVPAADASLFLGMLKADAMSHYIKLLILITTFIIVFANFFDPSKKLFSVSAEYNSLLLILMFGLFLMASASNLVMMYIAIETVSIPSYVLAGIQKSEQKSHEGALKYVLFGGFSSGIMLYGFSILYGLAGSTHFNEVLPMLANTNNPLAVYMAILLVLAGLSYKLSIVPFHFWTPDVYEGAPTSITAYFSVAPKLAAMTLLIRVFTGLFPAAADFSNMVINWPGLIAILAAVTMTVGNGIAVQQNNVKRLLAYSSIAHVGYMLMAVTILSETAMASILFYLTVYAIMNLAAFLVVMHTENRYGAEEISDYAGMGRFSPWMAILLTVLLISLTGLPPTAGFIGKFYLFAALVEAKSYYWLLVVGILNSVVSLFYYFRIVKSMYFLESDTKAKAANPVILIIVGILTGFTLLFGLFFNPLLELMQTLI